MEALIPVEVKESEARPGDYIASYDQPPAGGGAEFELEALLTFESRRWAFFPVVPTVTTYDFPFSRIMRKKKACQVQNPWSCGAQLLPLMLPLVRFGPDGAALSPLSRLSVPSAVPPVSQIRLCRAEDLGSLEGLQGHWTHRVPAGCSDGRIGGSWGQWAWGDWQPRGCRLERFTPNGTVACMQERDIRLVMFGDSFTRLLNHALVGTGEGAGISERVQYCVTSAVVKSQ